ncbi:MAG: glycosyltransferase family 4 protein [Chthoniobacterales bacterium]
MRSRYKNAELAIIATSLFTEGGDWRSIYIYARKAEADGRRVVLVNPRGKRGLRQTLAAWFFSPRVLVNGLASFGSWPVFALCLARPDVRIYLHETEHALDGYGRDFPLRFRLLRRILARNPILCVSEKAAALYRERFGSRETHVVYECAGNDHVLNLDPAKVHIVNVGSLNERKGVDLFSRVADLAKERHPEWQFHWVGGLASMNSLYRSPAVQWHGFMWQPGKLVKQCKVFFLSSVDDPCPLSALEALAEDVPCVVYERTGTAELVARMPGCAIYRDYTPEAALSALENALGSPAHAGERAAATVSITGLGEFSRLIDAAIGCP